MTDNEKIARWLEIKIYEGSGFTATEDFYIAKGEGKLLFVDGREDETAWYWQPDTDITLWHGKNGLLAEIEKEDLAGDFYCELEGMIGEQRQINPVSMLGQAALAWYIRRAEPDQLTAALVKLIKEE